MGKDVIVALDFPGEKESTEFLRKFGSEVKPYIKIGMELFYATGPEYVKKLKSEGYKIFLDLKLHDIPNTVGSAMCVLANLGVDMLNLHASGGMAMMRGAMDNFDKSADAPILLAVTVLTSTDLAMLQNELWVLETIENTVHHYAQNAQKSGLNGVVCSPMEVELVKDACGEDFLTVTPGIRFADGGTDDQKRVTTPEKAREMGSDYIVMGRPITKAEDPLAAYKRALKEFTGRDFNND